MKRKRKPVFDIKINEPGKKVYIIFHLPKDIYDFSYGMAREKGMSLRKYLKECLSEKIKSYAMDELVKQSQELGLYESYKKH